MKSARSIGRRTLLWRGGALVLAAAALAACGAPAAPPTAQPAPGGAAAAAKPAPSEPAKAAAPAAGGKVAMSVAVRTEANNQWQKHWAKQWAEKHPEVDLRIDEIVYDDMPKKQLAMFATGTMPDVTYNGIKWFPYSASKGMFMPLEDFVKSSPPNPGMDDFFESGLSGSTFEGKLYGLPSHIHPGNPAMVAINKNILGEKGIAMPTDDWSVKDYLDLMLKASDRRKKLFGTDYFPTNYYDFESLARSWEGSVMGDEYRKFTLATDPKTVEAARWAVELRAKHEVAPKRAEAQGLQFPAGQLATAQTSANAIQGLAKSVGDKFKWDVVLFPKGPTGVRGYQGFVVCWSIYSKSKEPERGWDLVKQMTSKETGIWAVLNNDYQPSGRKSVWGAPEVVKVHPIFERALAWMNTTKGPFPMPANLRFQELQDKWANVSPALFYGEAPFDDAIKKVQAECAAIMEQPRA